MSILRASWDNRSGLGMAGPPVWAGMRTVSIGFPIEHERLLPMKRRDYRGALFITEPSIIVFGGQRGSCFGVASPSTAPARVFSSIPTRLLSPLPVPRFGDFGPTQLGRDDSADCECRPLWPYRFEVSGCGGPDYPPADTLLTTSAGVLRSSFGAAPQRSAAAHLRSCWQVRCCKSLLFCVRQSSSGAATAAVKKVKLYGPVIMSGDVSQSA